MQAARIFAVSNFSKKDTERLFQRARRKIEVIYNAIDDRFRLGHATAEDRRLIAERYQVNYPFLLYAGRISPHKNVVRIIEAFSALKAELAEGRSIFRSEAHHYWRRAFQTSRPAPCRD